MIRVVRMIRATRMTSAAGLFGLALFSAGACSRAGGPDSPNTFGDAEVIFVNGIKCPPVASSEPLPARTVVSNPASGSSDGNTFFTSELFQRLGTYCNACHDSGQNGFSSKLRSQDWDAVFARIKSDNAATPGGFMPPPNAGGKPWSARLSDPNDAVVDLVRLLNLWISQGKPGVEFSLNPAGPSDGGVPDSGANSASAAQADYSLSPKEGESLTNIGTCLPSKYVVGINPETMTQLDNFFTRAKGLPDTLAETDLTTFDSDALARNGVVSFFPAYPLWSDAAGKMRHVRTPRGQPIVFDKTTQQFQIPPNTRFYKTFFKKVIQLDGSEAYKKLETRLIVARPDEEQDDGTFAPTALFGTYLWNDAETKAVLLKDPLHNGKPFSDRVITYVVDEPRAEAIRATNPRNLEYAFDVENPGVRRHYGIPSSERCIQCHMGSPNASFILGFTPLQIAAVAAGAAGAIEPAMGDEVTQLQRLISYGVIKGMTDPTDVTPLEKTQLPRTPRNAYELSAQGYMVGNCSHCHNPRGFPSVKAPDLKDVLNFLPGPNGGVFQFPLDRVSPHRARGISQDVPIPYLTPSLRDIPNPSTRPKYLSCEPGEATTRSWCPKTDQTDAYKVYVDAPWRSLIYRNVDTPFDYVEDSTIFPHMPMNTPGYDCRVSQIMGDWMVSIPATRVNAAISEDTIDTAAQPYIEVKPEEAGYAAAVTAAQKRLATYHAGHRYGFCPDTSDTVDPEILSGARQSPFAGPLYDQSTTPESLIMPGLGVPTHTHWVVTDATDPPGDWLPRNLGWNEALAQQKVNANAGVSGDALVDLQTVINILPTVSLDQPGVRETFLTEVPFTIWQQKPGCDFSRVRTAGSYQDADRPNWLVRSGATIAPEAPVYAISPGAAVFNNICLNCHGPKADAKGLLAEEISIMTGGDARVANFRTGLFGPEGAPGSNRTRVFQRAAADLTWPSGTPDDMGARYLSWMALGGTVKQIPPDLLGIVAVTRVAGKARPLGTQTASPNMLQLARQLCTVALLSSAGSVPSELRQSPLDWTNDTGLINTNGDAELWLKVCSLNNRPVVRVAYPSGQTNPDADEATQWGPIQAGGGSRKLNIGSTSLYWGDGVGPDGDPAFPPTAPVLDHRGVTQTGIRGDNLVPICLREPTGAEAHQIAENSRAIGGQDGYVVPWCPPGLFARGADGKQKWRLATTFTGGGRDAVNWATRGAINAGLAVFLYLDQLSKGLQPKPLYNQCELLSASGR
jgi:mono/diheme cytochrome c family protein